MIAWPALNGKPIGAVLRSSSWDKALGIIADQTRSGKFSVRVNHVKAPNEFSITMHMTLEEYRVFNNWWINSCRKGFYSFAFPKINDNTGTLVEYRFSHDSRPRVQNTSALNLEISMNWMEV
jgi:hypothetical protein